MVLHSILDKICNYDLDLWPFHPQNCTSLSVYVVHLCKKYEATSQGCKYFELSRYNKEWTEFVTLTLILWPQDQSDNSRESALSMQGPI